MLHYWSRLWFIVSNKEGSLLLMTPLPTVCTLLVLTTSQLCMNFRYNLKKFCEVYHHHRPPSFLWSKLTRQFCSELEQLLSVIDSYRTLSGCHVDTIFLLFLYSGVFFLNILLQQFHFFFSFGPFSTSYVGFGKWIKLVPTSQERKWKKHAHHYKLTSTTAHPQEVLKTLYCWTEIVCSIF